MKKTFYFHPPINKVFLAIALIFMARSGFQIIRATIQNPQSNMRMLIAFSIFSILLFKPFLEAAIYRIFKIGFLKITPDIITYKSMYYTIIIPVKEVECFETFTTRKPRRIFLGFKSADQKQGFGHITLNNLYLSGKYSTAFSLNVFDCEDRNAIIYTLNSII